MIWSRMRATVTAVCFFWLTSAYVLYGQSSVNLAVGKAASQSSLSEWSKPKDAQGAVDGVKDGGFGFHTNDELNPWWQVDLGTDCTIDKVVVYNREDCCSERARTISVMLSSDGVNFQMAYTHNGSVFGGVMSNRPLTVPMNNMSARFVRLQLKEKNALHLDEVEVYGKSGITQAQWVAYTGKIPANAVVGGFENGQPLYVGRAPFEGGMHPGKVLTGAGGLCNIGWGGKEYSFAQGFEILTAPANSVAWVEYNGTVPPYAILGGYNDAMQREPLYIAKHAYMGGEHCGKLWANACNIGWGGQEIVLNQKIYILTSVAAVKSVTGASGFSSYSQQGTYTSWNEKWKLPVAGKSAVIFTAKARNDLHIAFSDAPATLNPMYEIVIGGWGNTNCAIRRSSQGPSIVERAGAVRKPGAADQYWAMVDKDKKMISAGYGSVVGQNVIIETFDANFLNNVCYVAFSSWDSPIEYSDVKTTSLAATEVKPVITGPMVKTTSGTYYPGQAIVVEYSGFPVNSSAWINIIPKGKKDNEWGDYQYVRQKSGKLEFNLPFITPGDYEVRGYFDSFDYNVKARYSFRVESGGQ